MLALPRCFAFALLLFAPTTAVYKSTTHVNTALALADVRALLCFVMLTASVLSLLPPTPRFFATPPPDICDDLLRRPSQAEHLVLRDLRGRGVHGLARRLHRSQAGHRYPFRVLPRPRRR